MNCPKCNHENDPDASICSACGIKLRDDTPGRVEIRISKLAVASCVFALLGVPCLFLYERAATSKVIPAAPEFGILFLVLGGLAVIFGIAAHACIETNYGRITGRAYATIGIAMPIATFFLVTFFVAMTAPRSVAYRLYCGTNLSGIGKAMLIYSNDYDDEFPRAGGKNTKWGPTPNWKARTPAEAYGLNDGDGQASISASLYLLVKYAEVTPKSFVCKGKKVGGDKGASIFALAEYKIHDRELVDLWDFGPDPSRHCSYTYHLPYVKQGLTSASDPGMAVAADRNPWLDTPGRKARSVSEWAEFDPNGSRDAIKLGNTFTHQDDGQNVLFVDGHTTFEKQPNCGVDDDNIYTSQNAEDIEKGVLPTMTSQPANRYDSLLVHDPAKGTTK